MEAWGHRPPAPWGCAGIYVPRARGETLGRQIQALTRQEILEIKGDTLKKSAKKNTEIDTM